jgi:predicted phosphate transport protein (TIGR00153 family)
MFRRDKTRDPFFLAFSAHVAITVRAAGLLKQLFERPGEVKVLHPKIISAEHEGDDITHAAMKRLRSQWITPLDRPDIHTLMNKLDDVLDVIESIAQRFLMFDIKDTSAPAIQAAKVLESAVIVVQRAIELLPQARANAKAILECCVEINTFESEADALYRSAIAGLFTPGSDPLMVMKWRDIYEELEAATDLCEDVANTLEGVVLEYA